MATQFIVNEKGEKTGVVLSLEDYEILLNRGNINFELSDEYKTMIDNMTRQEENGKAEYKTLKEIQTRFLNR
ncbi:hypothetical protein [uncultured Mucilaginibacter sp.]|uniref:hypothetical protein n=1 Tax=uncultured Mucilaginibacter sp. TaxID=797541 RepID=UPI002634CE2D|nr:hypothetical protein [uncultured Mucilaginibacter sp.]